jgi:hypothetical protein
MLRFSYWPSSSLLTTFAARLWAKPTQGLAKSRACRRRRRAQALNKPAFVQSFAAKAAVGMEDAADYRAKKDRNCEGKRNEAEEDCLFWAL